LQSRDLITNAARSRRKQENISTSSRISIEISKRLLVKANDNAGNDYTQKIIITCYVPIRAITCHVNASMRESFSRVSHNFKFRVKFSST